PAPVPTLTWSEESFTMEATCENHEVVLMINGEAVRNPYTVEQTYEEQTITFVAYTVANADESGNSANVEQTVTVPAKAKTPSNKPSVVVTPGDNEYTIEATGTGTVELYVNGEKVENPYTIARPAYGEADITVEAYATNLDSDPEGEIQYEIATCDAQTVIVPAMEPTYYHTPDPVITVDVDNDAEIVTITATGEGTVTLKVTGINGTVGETSGQGTCSVVVPFGEEIDYVNAYATATAAGEFVYPGDATKDMIEIPAKAPVVPEQTAAPVIYQENNDDAQTVTVIAVGNGTVILYQDDVEVARGEGRAEYVVNYSDDPEGEEMGFSATAQEAGKLVSDYSLYDAVIPGKQPVDTTLDGEIVFGEVNQENGQFTVTYTGDEAVTITLDDETITLVRSTVNTYQLPAYGTYEVTATATGVGYDPISKPATLVWNAPVTPVVPPTITIDTDNDNYQVIVGAVAPQGDVTLYRVEDLNGTNPVEIANPTQFAMETESYTVYVMAKTVVDGVEYWSTVSQVVVPAKPVNPDPTSINEMNAGKTVAAVRYFNMAGQEMQEANGMTIVVTTYTDGTTSAVKVMK
ncbi:MAG: hypothetical protein IJV11_10605, partial [Muribaculaceae bacterium]|nr:hypothetical protein [Muribaculaceae bacterium]